MQKSTYEFISKSNNDPILERRTCPRTGEEFAIFQSDVEMLAKLSPTIGGKKLNIPLPRLSPEARQINRLLFRNERNFYNGKSALSGQKLFSLFAPEMNAQIISYEEFHSDAFDAMHYGQTIDLGRSVLDQLSELRRQVPTQSTMTIDNENCQYTTGTGYCKSCYLINSSENSENCMYGKLFQTCKDCLDCSYVYDSEKLYQCLNVKKGYQSMRLYNSQECSFCYFSDDLIACNHCMFCSGLRNASYCFQNTQMAKEQWEQETKKYLGTTTNISHGLQQFAEVRKSKINKYANIVNAEKSFGDVQTDNTNCVSCYETNGSKDCKYVSVGVEIKDVVDGNNIYLGPEKCYNNIGIMHVQDIHFCVYCFDSSNLLFCQECYDSHNLFGCVGLKNREYCIFNKQYTQAEYQKLVASIVQQMTEAGERGQFFPSILAPYSYNDSLAMEYFPIQKVIFPDGTSKIINPEGNGIVNILEPGKTIAQAHLDLGGKEPIQIKRKTKETEINVPSGLEKINASQLPESIDQVDDTMLQKIVICESSGRFFRILKQEIEFYRKMGLPLPHKHPSVRYTERLNQKPKRALYLRNCGKCGIEMLSVYPANSEFKVYCEKCYNKEIYG